MIGGLNDTETRIYYEYVVDMAVYFGAEKDRAENELYDVLQFEVELANVIAYCVCFYCFSFVNHTSLLFRHPIRQISKRIHRRKN